MRLKKPTAPQPPRPGEPAAGAGLWGGQYPTLCEFVLLTAWEDGSRRETGTLLVFCEGGMWKACVRDRAGRRLAFVSAETPEALLAAVDVGLERDSLDWRAERPQGGKRS